MKIRRAEVSDVMQVTEIEKECFSRPWTAQSFLFELESRDGWFSVCDDGGEILGFVLLHRFADEGEIFNIAVREDARRRGIANRLMESVFRGARKMGIKKLYLEVRRSNEPARMLYEKHGFQVCGLRKNYYDDPKEDAVLMDAEVPEAGEEETFEHTGI